MVVEHREAAKLENQILALQRKLDEERQARLDMEKVRSGLLIVVSTRVHTRVHIYRYPGIAIGTYTHPGIANKIR